MMLFNINAKYGLSRCVILVLALTAGLSVQANEPDAGIIAEKMIYRNDGDTLYRQLTMMTCRYQIKGSLRRCVSRPVRKVLEALDKDIGSNKRDSVELGIIIEPIDERFMAFLQKDYDQPGKETDQWMYFPALKKLKRIVSESPNSPKTGSVFGSEIAYEDAERMQLSDYRYSYLGEDLIDGRKCRLIEAMPTESRLPETSYGRQKIWVDMGSSAPLKRELYDKRTGKLAKTFLLKKMQQYDDSWVAHMEIVVNHLDKRMTLVRVDRLAVNIPFSESLFGLRSLEDTSFRESKLNPLRSASH